ncbi:MAG: hypothetical protein JWR67_3851 [Mucilaginibacter sp.]|nr:hypothetical protein [Mucilaginibacter sp.]MDB5112737.1 hypothetical protein [Mucilaginibacter sp.]
MKKKLLSISICLIFLCAAKANAQSTATVNLNITLSDVVSLTVPTTAVAFAFNSEAAYTDGVVTTVDDHLDVMSSRNYVISVNSGSITGTVTPTPLPTANTVSMTAAAGAAGGNYTGVTYAPITLASSAAALITSTASSFDATHAHTKYAITYTVGANHAYAGYKAGTVTIPVVYTITQP